MTCQTVIVLAAVVHSLGCGGFARPSTATDASVDRDANVDALDVGAGAACDLNKPFKTPTLVGGVNTTMDEFSARLSPDQLTVYVHNDSGGHDLFVATRATKQAPFGNPVPITELNTPNFQGHPSVTADGLTLYFTSSEPGGPGNFDIHSSSRPATTVIFSSPSVVANVNTAGPEDVVYATPDGTTLVLSNNTGGSFDLYSTSLVGGTFGAPQTIAAVNTTAGLEDFPVITADGLTLFYAHATANTLNAAQIFVAHRSTTLDGFGIPSSVVELNPNDGSTSAPTWISPDACDLYFISNRPNGVGGFDIYEASRPL